VNRVDDLVIVDPLKVGRRHTEVRVAKLPLNEVDRNPLARHLDSMGMTELVRREPASHPGLGSEAAKLLANRAWGERALQPHDQEKADAA
jgi:hypothetical protein